MIRDYGEIDQDAKDESAFSNSTESVPWIANWCDNCVHDDEDVGTGGCDIMLVALMGKTPAEWVPDKPMSLGHQYRCKEFEPTDEEK